MRGLASADSAAGAGCHLLCDFITSFCCQRGAEVGELSPPVLTRAGSVPEASPSIPKHLWRCAVGWWQHQGWLCGPSPHSLLCPCTQAFSLPQGQHRARRSRLCPGCPQQLVASTAPLTDVWLSVVGDGGGRGRWNRQGSGDSPSVTPN